MQALAFLGPGSKALQARPKPAIQAVTDAIVRMTRTSLCRTDLSILDGDVPSCRPGTVLGHEGVGVVDSVGAGVTMFRPGDPVLISCITSCGRCAPCRKGMPSHCVDGGWVLGHAIDGTQAEFVRIPHADTSLYPVADGADEEALVLFSDLLPTGYECGVLNGQVGVGTTVAIVGAGPVGLAALITAQLLSPAGIIVLDIDPRRLEVARRLGATATVDSADADAVAQVMKLSGGRGVDTAIEAVGIPTTFRLCQDIVAAGGHIANIGLHGVAVDLHLQRLWSHNVTISTRLVDTLSIPVLLRMQQCQRIDVRALISHRFRLERIAEAYGAFTAATEHQTLKVIVEI